MQKKTMILFLCIIVIAQVSFGQQEGPVSPLVDQIRQNKKTIVFLGEMNKEGKIQPHATAFLVMIKNVFHLVTAKHVIMEYMDGKFTGKLIDSNLLAVFNMKDGGIGWRYIAAIKNKYGVNWVFHQNENVDIAVIPFPLDPQKDDVVVIPDSMFITADRIFELYDVYFLSYQPGIEIQDRILPIIRTGTISLINKDRTFYIDGFAFPGNSGSPVFIKPLPMRFGDKGSIEVGPGPLGGAFVGIIGEYIPYQEFAISTQTKRPRVVFEENTGLSKIWSVEFIKEIMESTPFTLQLKKLIKK